MHRVLHTHGWALRFARDQSVSAAFMDEFTSAMFLPHTDLDRFPNVRNAMERKER